MDPQKAQMLIKAIIGIAQVLMLLYNLNGGTRSSKKNEAYLQLEQIIKELKEIE